MPTPVQKLRTIAAQYTAPEKPFEPGDIITWKTGLEQGGLKPYILLRYLTEEVNEFSGGADYDMQVGYLNDSQDQLLTEMVCSKRMRLAVEGEQFRDAPEQHQIRIRNRRRDVEFNTVVEEPALARLPEQYTGHSIDTNTNLRGY